MPGGGARTKQIFIDEREDSIRFYLHSSISRQAKETISRNIQKHGGTVAAREVDASYVLISKKAGKGAVQAAYAADGDERKRSLIVQFCEIIKESIEGGRFMPHVERTKGMSGRIGGKRPFTEEEDIKLARYIASQLPSGDSGGRRGQNLYKTLVGLCEVDRSYEWVKAHTWESWRNRYNKNTAYFDRMIESLIPEVNPARKNRFGADRRRNGGGRLFDSDDEEGEEEGDEDEGGGGGGEEEEVRRQSDDREQEIELSPPRIIQPPPNRTPQRSVAFLERRLNHPVHTQATAQEIDQEDEEVEMELRVISGTSSRTNVSPPRGDGTDQVFQASQPPLSGRLRPSDAETPPTKRRRINNVPSPQPTRATRRRPGATEVSRHAGATSQNLMSPSAGGSEGSWSEAEEEEDDPDLTAVHSGVTMYGIGSPSKKSTHNSAGSNPNLSSQNRISGQSTLVESAPHIPMNEDSIIQYIAGGALPEESDGEEFEPIDSSPIKELSSYKSMATQPESSLAPSPVKSDAAPPARPPPALRGKKTAQRSPVSQIPPPIRMTRARSRSQSVEPEYFQSLPLKSTRSKGKGKARQESPLLAALQEDQDEYGIDTVNEDLPPETLAEEQDVVQIITNEDDYSAGTLNLDDFEHGENAGSLNPRASSLESDDIQMSAQLEMKPPRQPAMAKAGQSVPLKPTHRIHRALENFKASERDARQSLPLAMLGSARSSPVLPMGLTSASRPRGTIHRSKAQQSTPHFTPVPRRAVSITSSVESYPLPGTRASTYKRRKTEEERHTPYKPPRGTRASLLPAIESD